MRQEILRMENISKRSSGVKILDGFRLNIFKGEIVGLLALSGSGKSMVARLLAGQETPDAGSISVDEQLTEITSHDLSRAAGIFIIHHQTQLVPQLSIAENIFVIRGVETRKLLVDYASINRQSAQLLQRISFDVSPELRAGYLNPAQQHLVEAVKAIAANARLIVFDDITASYTQKDFEKLAEVIFQLKEQGISILFESQKPDELLKIADRIVVMRDGKIVKTAYKDSFDRNDLINLLVGYETSDEDIRVSAPSGEVALAVEDLCSNATLQGVSFSLRKGEILGILDVEDKANLEIGNILLGLAPRSSGSIFLNGKPVIFRSLKQAFANGFGLIPQDSINQGLFANMTTVDNLSLLVIKRTGSPLLGIKKRVLKFLEGEYFSQLGLERKHSRLPVELFDVYTRQRMVFHKWMLYRPQVLVCIKPFSMADIINRRITQSMLEMASRQGISVLVISSDLSEVAALCNRVVILADGKVKSILTHQEIITLNASELYLPDNSIQ